MSRTFNVGWILALALSAAAAQAADAPDAVLETISVPEGFAVEVAAAPPLVKHPIMAGFDDRGRLFVADNAGLNLPAEELLEKRPNLIRMLEDTDGDGRFDRSTVFADGMTFPQGAAWYRGALYVASPPEIWRLEDTDDDGVADRRQKLVEKFGFTGNAADIHGCFVTPTGRIAWCDGRHGHEFTDAEGHAASEGLAARVFTCRPDGSDVEVFCGGGMDNPVEVTFTPAGDTIGTMTFYNPDADRHDALVHFVYGGVYPKKHPCTSEFKRTGELLPALSRFGVVAPSGLMCYAGAAWGDEYRDNLFSTQFNTHKIVRHVLSPRDATFSSVDHDFLVSASSDFHPTDVLEDADGSLLVVDTGGWFRIGCPTSQIAKPEIGGAIYRVRRTTMEPPADPRGKRIDWPRVSDTEMADLLSDPRPAVTERVIEILAERGDAAMGTLATALFDNPDYRARQYAVWALARNGSDNARMLLRQVLADDDAPVRLAAAHACADLRDLESLPILLELLERDEPAVKREAATGLGRLRQSQAVSGLLEALAAPTDRFLEHAIIYALIEINDPGATVQGLSHASPAVRRGSLIALDQMEDGHLTSEQVASLLQTDDRALLAALVDVLARHADWTDEIAGTLGNWLVLASPTADEIDTARGAVTALGHHPAVEKLVADALAGDRTAKPVRLMLLEVLAAAEFDEPPAVYAAGLQKSLSSSDSQVVRQAALTVRALDARPFVERLMALGLDTRQPAEVRLAALHAAATCQPGLPDTGFDYIRDILSTEGAIRDRLAAAEALAGFELTDQQRKRVTELVATSGPLELSWLLRAFDREGQEGVGQALVEALAKSPALASVSNERLRDVLEKYPSSVQEAAAPLLARRTPDDAERAAKLKALESDIQSGDSARGEDLFFSERAACSACHRVGTRGEKIGPDLSKIGEVRNRRDLLEAILFPSSSLARGYESFHVVTGEGKVHTGLLGRETATAIFLRTTDRTEIRIARAEIDELTPSTTSIMPQGMEKILTPRELADVVAYLQSLK